MKPKPGIMRLKCICVYGNSFLHSVAIEHALLKAILIMYKSIEPILNLVKINHFSTSDIFFDLNTKITSILLLHSSVLLTMMDVLRTSIDCYTDMSGNVRKLIMDNFCWSTGTYICKNQTSGCFNPLEDNKMYQRYYQWISFVFIIQAAILYMPAYFWKVMEGGILYKICEDLGTITF